MTTTPHTDLGHSLRSEPAVVLGVAPTSIAISDLVAACQTVGETRVLAAGTKTATILVDDADRLRLDRAGIDWHLNHSIKA